MDCKGCGQSNPDGAKFCSECGAPLARSCAHCAASSAPGAKFCGECGLRVGDTSESDRPSIAPLGTATRKQVTALFADLVGSTAFGESVDGEVARATLADYFELLESTIETHAGFVAKFTGDGVMAVFGLPEVAEDDALRAVDAGRELQRRFAGFADRARTKYGAELGLRVGVNTGELVVGDGDADLVGDVLNTAARLEAACVPGGVLVGEETWRLTRSSVVYEIAGDIRAKGKAQPVATFAVVDAASVQGDDTPFVGRTAELDTLADTVADVRDSQRPRLVTVIGAPGVGKTRLAAEVRASSGAQSFDLRIERRGGTTFSPIADLIRDAAGGVEPEAVGALVRDQPDGERLTTALVALAGSGRIASTEETFLAVRRLVEVLAADGPVVLVIDDIQWAEPLFWDLLEHIAEWGAGPVLLLALARPELRELRPELTHAGRVVAASIDLEGLDSDTTAELARSLLDGADLPRDLIDQLPSSTDGNPLFVRELVRMLVDDGVLERADDAWRLTVDVEALDVPPTVLSLLASRVERLPDDEREVLELASVIGTEFDRGALVELGWGGRSTHVGALLDRLRRKDLVHPSGAWAGDEPVFRFHHVLLRDAAYRRLLKSRRAELHERMASHVVAVGVGGSDETDVAAALHYEQAHRFRSELGESGDDVDALAAAAAERLAAAAARALDRDDLDAATSYTSRALDLNDGSDRRDDLLLVGCEALLSAGDAVRAEPLVDELVARSTDDRVAGWADCFRAQRWTLTDSNRLEEAAAVTEDAAQRLERLGDDAGLAKARLVRAVALARRGRIADCEHELDIALAAARRADDRRRVAAVLGATPLAALWGPSPAARAGGRCLDVLRLLHITAASPGVEATSYRCQGVLEALRGRFDSARAKLETSGEIVRELGLRQGVMETELFAGIVELLADEPRIAAEHLRTAADGLGELGIGAEAGRAQALLAIALLGGGDVEEAESLALAAQGSAGQNLQTAIASSVALAQVRAEQGRLDEAEELVGDAIALAEPTDVVLDRALALGVGARIAAAAGDPALAAERRSTARRLTEDKGSQHWIGVSSADVVEVFDVDENDSALDGPAVGPLAQSIDIDPAVAEIWREIGDRQYRLGRKGSPEDFRATFTYDFEYIDHRPLGQGRLGPDEYAATLALIAGSSTETVEVVRAERHQLLVVERTEFADGATVERMTLTRHRDGLLTGLEHFALDARAAAVARFDTFDLVEAETLRANAAPTVEEDLDSGDPAQEVGASPLMQRYKDARAASDRQMMRAVLTESFRLVDHRRVVGWGDLSAEEWMDIEFDSGVRPVDFEVGEVLAAQPGLRLYSLNQAGSQPTGQADGELMRGHHLVLSVAVDGLLDRIEMFDLDDRQAAMKRFETLLAERRTTPSSPMTPNEAWRVVQAIVDGWRRGDVEAVRSLMAEGYTSQRVDDLDIGPVDAKDHISMISEYLGDTDIAEYEVTLLATRGDQLCAFSLEAPSDVGEIRRAAVMETRDRKAVSTRWFVDADLSELRAVLDQRAIELDVVGDVWVRVSNELNNAVDRQDADAVRTCASEGFVLVDRRALGFGELGRDRWVDIVVTRPDGNRTHTVEIIRSSDRVSLVTTKYSDPDEHEWWMLHLSEIDDTERLVRLEIFGVDQRAEAIARFDELLSASPSEITNGAVEALRGAIDAELLDSDGSGRGFAPTSDAVREARDDLVPRGDLTPEQLSATLRELWEHGLVGTDVEVLAVRDEYLCLARCVNRFEDGDTTPFLAVCETVEGRLASVSVFPPEQLDEAADRLDRRWAEFSGLPQGRITVSMRAAGYGPECRRFLTDDFEMVDHKPLGLGRLGPDEWITTTSATVDVAAFYHRQFLHADERLALSEIRSLATDGSEWASYQLATLRGDLVERWEIFGLDQKNEALTRLDELRAAWEMTHGTRDTENLDADCGDAEVVRVLRRVIDATLAEDWRTLGKLIDSEFQWQEHQRFATKSEYRQGEELGSNLSFWTGRTTSVEVEQMATRGADLALVWNTMVLEDGFELRFPGVARLAENGKLVHLAYSDAEQLDEAVDVLDRMWVESGVAEHSERPPTVTPLSVDGAVPSIENRCSELLRALVEALHFGGSPEMLAEFTEPGFVWRERRRTIPHLDLVGDEVLERWRAWESLGLTDVSVTTLATRDDDLALARTDGSYADGSAHGTLAVQELGESGLVVSTTLFDHDELDEAFGLLSDLWVARGGCAWFAELIDRRTDDRDRLLLDDGLLVDHRPLGFGRVTGREYAEMQRTEHQARIDIAMVLDFDDRRLLTLSRGSRDEAEWLAYLVVERGIDGARQIDIFPVDDLSAAQRRYDEIVDSQR